MARMILRAALVLCLVVVIGSATTAQAETIQVPPTLTAGQKVISTTVFQPGHSYKLTITGTVEAQRKDGSDHLVFNAFHCVSGCPDHNQNSHIGIADADSGQALLFSNLNKHHDATEYSTYNEHGIYILTMDDFQETRRLAWTAMPFGVNPDSRDRYYSGEGFKVVIDDVTPPPCKAPRPAIPSGPSVAWVVLQGGPPTRHPEELTDTVTVTRGAAGLGKRQTTDFGDSWALRDPVGVLCHEDHFALAGHATRKTSITVSYRAFNARLTRNPHTKQRYLALQLRITESDDPSCAVGTTGVARLFDRRGSDRMALDLGGKCQAHSHEYTKGLKVVIKIDE
jgi:hypothetical protein